MRFGVLHTAAGALAVLALAGCASHATTRQTPQQPGPVHVQPVAARLPGCTQPTPTTPAGFTRLFASLPPAQWGAADVSISVPLAGGRSVWLYGDTFSSGRFVHSTAITQDKGCLHVSRAGAQLLPNDDAQHIYWVDSARRVAPGGLAVKARSIVLSGACAWCFKDGGYFRTALVTVTAAGDATFQRWTAKTIAPASNPGPMYTYGPHHFGYARHVHPEFKLTRGGVLVTTCQNWDDGAVHPMTAYRPIFTASR